MQSPEESIATYIRAKDQNRPHLMTRAFAEAAILEMVVKTGSIAFPPISKGLETISDVLVRRFAQTYENVHTFCLAAPPRSDEVSFSCSWLVGMSEKESRMVRVGCGRYDWLFRSQSPHLVERLTITIDLMQSLAPNSLPSIMNWLSQLPYPWCSSKLALPGAPTLDELEPIRHYIAL
jgi:hypothetical protein